MRFRFDTSITADDYLAFNIFCEFDSPEGKKRTKQISLIFLFYFLYGAFKSLLTDGLTLKTLLFCIIWGLFQLILAFLCKKVLRCVITHRYKRKIKSGEYLFSPNATLEFYDDKVVEISEYQRLEVCYEGLQKIRVVSTKYIYIFDSSASALILTIPQVMQQANAADFLKFLSEKCSTVEYY